MFDLCLDVLNSHFIKWSETKDAIYLKTKYVLSLRESGKSKAKKALVEVDSHCTLFHPAQKLKDLVLFQLASITTRNHRGCVLTQLLEFNNDVRLSDRN